jgi:predicted permease
MTRLWLNVRYAIRILRKSPGFAAIAILSLALGIGANTAIFSIINALLLRDLPVRQPQRLVELSASRPDSDVPFSYPMFREVQRGQRVFSGLIGWSPSTMVNVEVNGDLDQNIISSVTGNYYSELGVVPFLGRLLAPDDENPSGGLTSQVAVISYEFWQSKFAGARDIVGKQILIEGHAFTIVGVTRKWFAGMTPGEPPEITIPITAYPSLMEGNEFTLETRSLLWVFVTGRLKDGVNIPQARAQLQSFWPEVLLATVSTQEQGPRRETFLSMGLKVVPVPTGIARDLRSQFSLPLYVLLGIVGLILLVACINLANLMLARAAARGHEMSVRVAIGASRWSLVFQVLTESLMLSLFGALLGLALAYWGGRLLVILMTQGASTRISLDLNPDLRVLLLTAGVTIFTGILFGIAPAWRCSREDPAAVLQQNARSLSGGTGLLGKALIVTQVALSLVLLLGAGLLIKNFALLRSVSLGFEKKNLLEVSLYPRPGGYEHLDMKAYHRQLLERISSIPGVHSVGFSDMSIPATEAWHATVSAASADSTAGPRVMTDAVLVSPGFFQTLGIPLFRGRGFSQGDDQGQPVAIVSNALAQKLFLGGDAIGRRVRFGFMPQYQNIEIIGISTDARIIDPRNPAPPVIFFSYLQFGAQWGALIIRTDVPPQTLARAVDAAVSSLGHEYALRTETISQAFGGELVEERATALLSGFFAALALLLASIGLYGLMSYVVTRRTREIGIRVALGAQRTAILWLVLRETLILVIFGVTIGIPCGLAASRLIASLLFGVSPGDSTTIVGVSLLILVVGLFAGYLPARRASSIDPVVALRME